MDTVLTAITLFSLAVAIALAVVVARLLRAERRRSEARVAALSALADGQAPVRATPPRTVSDAADLEIRRPAGVETAVTGHSDLFAEPEVSSPWGRRLAVIGVIVLVGGAAVFGLLQQRDTARDDVAAPAAVQRPVAGSSSAPLELVSLRHTQQGAALTIVGLVQNPRSGAALTRLVATAVVFGPDGALLGSGKAPLDYTTLGAGDESPFVINVPVNGAVARYRVGFRAEDGSVVAHVDRRLTATGDRGQVSRVSKSHGLGVSQ